MANYIINFSFIVRHTRTHLRLKRFYRKNLNTDIYFVTHIKCQMFDKKVICYIRIFAKLNFYGHPFFYKISLIVAPNRFFPGCLYFLFLTLQVHGKSFSN